MKTFLLVTSLVILVSMTTVDAQTFWVNATGDFVEAIIKENNLNKHIPGLLKFFKALKDFVTGLSQWNVSTFNSTVQMVLTGALWYYY